MGLDALFPEKAIADHVSAVRRPWPAADVLAAVADEADVLMVIVGDIEEGRPIKDSDIARARLARQRIREATDLALGKSVYRSKYRGDHGRR